MDLVTLALGLCAAPRLRELPERLRKRLRVDRNNGCWTWIGKWTSGNGYGKTSWKGRDSMAHRVIYAILRGPIPDGRVLDHKCRNRACCNPWHLRPVTVRQNTHLGDAVLFEKEAA